MEKPESGTRPVKLLAGVSGEVEAAVFVVVEHGGVYRAVHKSENGVRRRRDEDGLNVGHEKVVVGL